MKKLLLKCNKKIILIRFHFFLKKKYFLFKKKENINKSNLKNNDKRIYPQVKSFYKLKAKK